MIILAIEISKLSIAKILIILNYLKGATKFLTRFMSSN